MMAMMVLLYVRRIRIQLVGWRGQLTTSLLCKAYLNDNSEFFSFQITLHLIMAMRRISRILLIFLFFFVHSFHSNCTQVGLLFIFFINSSSHWIVCFIEVASAHGTDRNETERERDACCCASQSYFYYILVCVCAEIILFLV